MSYVQERYSPVIVGVNATVPFAGDALGGFLCITSGSITVSRLGSGVATMDTYVPVVSALPVTAGVYYPIPFHMGHLGGQLVASGGASGVMGTS